MHHILYKNRKTKQVMTCLPQATPEKSCFPHHFDPTGQVCMNSLLMMSKVTPKLTKLANPKVGVRQDPSNRSIKNHRSKTHRPPLKDIPPNDIRDKSLTPMHYPQQCTLASIAATLFLSLSLPTL